MKVENLKMIRFMMIKITMKNMEMLDWEIFKLKPKFKMKAKLGTHNKEEKNQRPNLLKTRAKM